MTAFSVRVFAPLFLEGDNLFAPALLEDLARYRGASHERRSRLWLLAAQHEDVGNSQGLAHDAGQLLDDENVVGRHFVLLAAGADDREHCEIPWERRKNMQIPPGTSPRE